MEHQGLGARTRTDSVRAIWSFRDSARLACSLSSVSPGLNGANPDLNRAYFRGPRGPRRLEMEFQCLFQVGKCFPFGFALAGDIHFEALRDVPFPFASDGRCKWPFHADILSQGTSNSILWRRLQGCEMRTGRIACATETPSDRIVSFVGRVLPGLGRLRRNAHGRDSLPEHAVGPR